MPSVYVFFIALVVRLCWVFYVLPSRKLSPLNTATGSDSDVYLAIAQNIRLNFVFGITSPTYFRGPGYPAFIAMLWDSLVAICLAQAIIGAGTAFITYKLVSRFGKNVALIAGIGMALAPMSIFTTTEIMTETLYTFLLVLACYLWGENRLWFAGIAFGLSWLVRPTTMAFLVFATIATLIIRKQRRAVATIAFAALLTVTPWIVRNAIVFHKFIPVAVTGGGTNLLSGSLDFTFGKDVWAKWWADPLLQTPYPRESTETDKLFFSRAVKRIKSDPIHWLRNRVRQYPWLFIDTGAYLHPTNLQLASAVKWAFVLGNALVLLLALWGAVLHRHELHLVLFPLFIVLFHLPLWVEPRYSLPMVPLMIALSSIVVGRLQSILGLKIGLNRSPISARQSGIVN